MAIYVYFFIYLKNKSTNSHYFGCLLFWMLMAIRQLNIEGRTYYFYNDLITIKNININNLKLDKKGVLGNDIYYIGYITKKKHNGMSIV